MGEAPESGEIAMLPKRAPSNTREAFHELRGATIVGFLHGALPLSSRPNPTTTLILHDGSGFTFNHATGAYWRESAPEVERAVRRMEGELRQARDNYEAVLALAGPLRHSEQSNNTENGDG